MSARDTGTAEVWTIYKKNGEWDDVIEGPDVDKAEVVRSEWRSVAEELAERLHSQMVGWEPGRECDCMDCVLFARFDSLTKEKKTDV